MIEKKMTTKEVAESLGCAVKTVLENAKKCLPNKVFENGKTTEWNEAEITILIEQMKSSRPNQNSFTAAVKAVSTTMTPATETSPDINEFQYSKEDICSVCNVSGKTLERFLAETSMSNRDFIVLGSSHKKFYNENVLKQFQLWLMNNQVLIEYIKLNITSIINHTLPLRLQLN